MGLADARATPSTGTPRAWRPPPARSGRVWATRSAWPWRPAASAACSTPRPSPAQSVFDHHIWCIVSDGDIEEGISHEASALAGHQQLGNLTVIYDDNEISIEDDTRIAKSEDVAARYEAYGWHVQTVDWRSGDADQGDYHEDVEALYAALLAAKAETGRPSFIALRTIIGWPAPEQAEHRQDPRLGARRRRGEGHQADPRLRPGADLPGRRGGARATPAR